MLSIPSPNVASNAETGLEPDYFVQPFIDLLKEPIPADQVDLLSKEDLLLYNHLLYHLRFLNASNLTTEEYVRGVVELGYDPAYVMKLGKFYSATQVLTQQPGFFSNRVERLRRAS